MIPTLSDPVRQPSRLVSSNESNSLNMGICKHPWPLDPLNPSFGIKPGASHFGWQRPAPKTFQFPSQFQVCKNVTVNQPKNSPNCNPLLH